MLPFVQNFPMFGIMLCVLSALCSLMLKPNTAKQLALFVCIVQAVLSAILLIYILELGASYIYPMGHFSSPFGNELRAGPLEALFALLFSLVMLFSLMGGTDDIRDDIEEHNRGNYYIMTSLLLAAQLVIIYTNDLFTSFVFIELITLAACSIISIKQNGKTLVATMWYLIMSLVGGGLLLLSISMLYGITGHLLISGLGESIAAIAATGRYTLPLFIVAALMCTSLSIKCALFPFHTWLPRAHASATTASSAILSALVVKCYIFLMLKIFVRVFGASVMAMLRITDILLIMGVLGLLFGSLQALRQKEIKTMLAYSSVAQIGYIFIGIGVNTTAGLVAACFQIIAHAIAKAMLFSAAGGLSASSSHKKDWNSLRGAGRRDKVAGAAFTFGALSMVGIPLFPGFVAKMNLASASSGTPFTSMVLIAVLVIGTLLNAIYYLPAVLCIYAQGDDYPQVEKSPATRISLWAFMAICLGLGVIAQPIIRIIETGLELFGM